MRMIVTATCLILGCSSMVVQPRGGGSSPPATLQIPASLFEKAIACIKEHEGWHGNHLPYVGFGHKLLPGETFTPDMTKAQADSLLRADLLKLCCMCSRFGKDALILSEISDKIRPSLPNSRVRSRLCLRKHPACLSIHRTVFQIRYSPAA